MLVALDFDNTITKDPDLWLKFIELLRSRGHNAVIATYRRPTHAINATGIDIHYTCGKAKKQALAERGVFPDIWIDDNSYAINFDEMWGMALDFGLPTLAMEIAKNREHSDSPLFD